MSIEHPALNSAHPARSSFAFSMAKSRTHLRNIHLARLNCITFHNDLFLTIKTKIYIWKLKKSHSHANQTEKKGETREPPGAEERRPNASPNKRMRQNSALMLICWLQNDVCLKNVFDWMGLGRCRVDEWPPRGDTVWRGRCVAEATRSPKT